LSHSSDDGDLLKELPFAPRSKEEVDNMMMEIATEASIIIESNSSDNGEEKDCEAQTPISKNSEDLVA
jgi:hypothetical protein